MSDQLDDLKVESRKHFLDRGIISFSLQSSDTNETTEENICNALENTLDTVYHLEVFGVDGHPIRFPAACLANAPDLQTLTTSYLIHDSFESFPSTLYSISIKKGFVSRNASTWTSEAATAFKENGDFSWDSFWHRFPDMSMVVMDESRIQGRLPEWSPYNMTMLSLRDNRLTGFLPSGLLSNFSDPIDVDISFNNFDDAPVPNELFQPFDGFTNIDKLSFAAVDCALGGNLPTQLLQPLEGALARFFSLDLSSNRMTGSIVGNFIPGGMLADGSGGIVPEFHLNLAYNGLIGNIPASLFEEITYFGSFSFSIAGNELSGSVPPIFQSGYSTPVSNFGSLLIDLSRNNFQSSLPHQFVTTGLTQNVTFSRVTLLLNNNEFDGTIPLSFLWTDDQLKRVMDGRRSDSQNVESNGENISSSSIVAQTRSTASLLSFTAPSTEISLSYNKLTGSIPLLLFTDFSTHPNTEIKLHLTSNQLSGTIPDLFARVTNGYRVTFEAENNSLVGPLPSRCWTDIDFVLLLAGNDLNSTIPSQWQGCRMPEIDVSSNVNLQGSIPPRLFNESHLEYFNASYTSLSGPLPTMAASSTVGTLDLSHTLITFCNSTPPSSSTLRQCQLQFTEACQCQATYASSGCVATCGSVPMPQFVSPIPSSPTSTSRCPAATRPSPAFYCTNGVWVAATVTAPTLTIPAGAGLVVVTANLTASTIILNGLGSSVQVLGCASNLTSIQVDLTKTQADQLGKKTKTQQLVTLSPSSGNSSCLSDLSAVQVSSRVVGSGCKKVKVAKQTSNEGSSLSGLFSIDSSSCNTWWIILVSVVCGVILLAVIATILLVAFCKPVREKIRPYTRARKNRATSPT